MEQNTRKRKDIDAACEETASSQPSSPSGQLSEDDCPDLSAEELDKLLQNILEMQGAIKLVQPFFINSKRRRKQQGRMSCYYNEQDNERQALLRFSLIKAGASAEEGGAPSTESKPFVMALFLEAATGMNLAAEMLQGVKGEDLVQVDLVDVCTGKEPILKKSAKTKQVKHSFSNCVELRPPRLLGQRIAVQLVCRFPVAFQRPFKFRFRLTAKANELLGNWIAPDELLSDPVGTFTNSNIVRMGDTVRDSLWLNILARPTPDNTLYEDPAPATSATVRSAISDCFQVWMGTPIIRDDADYYNLFSTAGLLPEVVPAAVTYEQFKGIWKRVLFAARTLSGDPEYLRLWCGSAKCIEGFVTRETAEVMLESRGDYLLRWGSSDPDRLCLSLKSSDCCFHYNIKGIPKRLKKKRGVASASSVRMEYTIVDSDNKTSAPFANLREFIASRDCAENCIVSKISEGQRGKVRGVWPADPPAQSHIEHMGSGPYANSQTGARSQQ